ncbi:alpha/beta family hydrolase [Terricaulis sp.]|uniref:alpha/beta hydrolase family protein n=1 Tax=Terricaulis sp. TaxID=2768686 RepID=UPI00378405C1
MSEALSLAISETQAVSALLDSPASPRAVYVFAHSAGAGMTQPFMAQFAAGLAERDIATLRYQFAYMESGSKRPDPPKLAHAAVRAAAAEAHARFPQLPIVAGGKSFGGRMTSQAQALEPMPGVVGVAFIAFPLHPAGKPSDERAKHLDDVRIPMLFLSGTNDALAELDLLRPVVQRLGTRATLHLLEHADHSFHVLARTGRKDAQVLEEALDAFAAWVQALLN